MEKNIRIQIESKQYDYDNFDVRGIVGAELIEEIKMVSEGKYSENGTRIELTYNESEEAGLLGCQTTVFFDTTMPDMMTTLRSGSVETALVFEKGKRNICVYEVPEGRFEVCVYTMELNNGIKDGTGCIDVDYVIEIGGVKKMRTKLKLAVL